MMKGQQGFTLLELVITVAITGLIVGFLGTAIFQMITVAERGGDKMLAMHELQNAAHWVTRDGQMAHNVTSPCGNELVLTMRTLCGGYNYTVTYSLYPLGSTRLRRFRERGVYQTYRIVARNISYIFFTFCYETSIITMNITSSPDGRANVSKSGTYKVHLRLTE